MNKPPSYTSWKIVCRSPEEAESLRQWLARRIQLVRVLTDTVCITPNGVKQVKSIPHRLGDHFADIRMVPDSQANPSAFRLVFQRRPEAGRFWKDLMVNILQKLEKTLEKPSIDLDSKGEDGPISHLSAC